MNRTKQGGSIGIVKLMFALLVALPFQSTAPINKQDSQVQATEPTVKVQKAEKPRKAERPARTKRVKPAPQPKPAPVVVPTPVATPVITGNKETWLRASGIPENLWSYVDQIGSR